MIGARTAPAACLAAVLAGGPAAAATPGGTDYWGLSCSALAILQTATPTYYAIELVPTRRVPGTGLATGIAHATFAHSPFGVALTPDGHYVYTLDLSVERLQPPTDGLYTAWVSTTDLDDVKRFGALEPQGDRMTIAGDVAWNKFLVIVTLEPAGALPAEGAWRGPVVLRGMSRSGLMHTLAGHGPFENEPCLKYGYR